MIQIRIDGMQIEISGHAEPVICAAVSSIYNTIEACEPDAPVESGDGYRKITLESPELCFFFRRGAEEIEKAYPDSVWLTIVNNSDSIIKGSEG